MILLQLCCSMLLEVFTQRNFVAEFIRFKLIFILKNDKFTFWATIWGTKGQLRTSAIAHWRARSRLSIRDEWTFFASSYGWDVISRYWSKSALFRGGGSLWAQILGGMGCRHPTFVGVRKLECFCYLTVKTTFVWVRYQRVTDGRTDRQTDRRTDGIAVANTALCIASNAAALQK